MGIREVGLRKLPSSEAVDVGDKLTRCTGNLSRSPYDHSTDQQLAGRRQELRRSLTLSPSSSSSSTSSSRWLAEPLPSPIKLNHLKGHGACSIATRAYFTSSDGEFNASSSNDHSTSSHSTLHSTSSIRRRVRFEVDVKNEIDAVVISYLSLIDLDDDKQKNEIWWSQVEITKTFHRSRAIIGAFRENMDYMDQYSDVFSLCARSDVDLSQHEDGQETTLDISVLRLLQSEARGLETQILALLHQYRTKFVQSVLRKQNDLSLDCIQSGEKQAMMLSDASRAYSRTGRVLARILAISDREILSGSLDETGPF